MLNRITQKQSKYLEVRLNDLLSACALPFSELTPRKVPTSGGVYVIFAKIEKLEHPYYVGRTKNLQQRLYNNHLMGPPSNARLKKHLVSFGECASHAEAKQFLRDHCFVRWVEQEGYRERGAIEGYATGLLFPKYGIYEEH